MSQDYDAPWIPPPGSREETARAAAFVAKAALNVEILADTVRDLLHEVAALRETVRAAVILRVLQHPIEDLPMSARNIMRVFADIERVAREVDVETIPEVPVGCPVSQTASAPSAGSSSGPTTSTRRRGARR